MPCSGVKPVLLDKDFFLSPRTSRESRAVCIALACSWQEKKRVKTKHTLSAGGFWLRFLTHSVLLRVLHWGWQLLWSGSEIHSEPKLGLRFVFLGSPAGVARGSHFQSTQPWCSPKGRKGPDPSAWLMLPCPPP